MSDARVRYTKSVIKDSFLNLLKDKPVDKITVTELCTAAGINRATFYSHYDDCFDLLRRIEDDFLEQFRGSGKGEQWCNSKELISSIYDTVADNIELCDVLIFNVENPTLLKRMIESAREKCMIRWRAQMTTCPEEEQDMLFLYLATGLSEVMHKYYKSCDKNKLIDFMVYVSDTVLRPFIPGR